MKTAIKRKGDIKMQKQVRAAIYCRVATRGQLSLTKQKKLICNYAKAKGYTICSITSEIFRGITLKRPGVQKVLTDAKNGLMEILLIADISRIGRNMIKAMRFIHELRDFGVDIKFVKQEEA